MSTICHQQDKNNLAQLLIFAHADITLVNKDGLTAFHMLQSCSLHKTIVEACTTREQAFQQLGVLKTVMRRKIIQTICMPIDDLAVLIVEYTIPYCKSHHHKSRKKSQSEYTILNNQIIEQWTQSTTRRKRKACDAFDTERYPKNLE